MGVLQQGVVRAYSENSDSVAFFLVVPQTHCMSLGKLPYFSVHMAGRGQVRASSKAEELSLSFPNPLRRWDQKHVREKAKAVI